MNRALLMLAATASLLAASPAHADPEEEVMHDYQPGPIQIVEAPRPGHPFGVPNVSEFDPNPPAETGSVRIVPYPRPTYPFGVPNVSEFEPVR